MARSWISSKASSPEFETFAAAISRRRGFGSAATLGHSNPDFAPDSIAAVRPILRRGLPRRLLAVYGAALLCLASAGVHAATQERPDDELRQILIEAAHSTDSFNDRFDAEVWLTDMARRLDKKVSDPEERLLILKTAHYEATRADLPPELVLAVIDIESNFDRFAISHAGARGLMQVMPFWLDEIGRPNDDLFDIRTNLRLGCTILRHYLDREKGDKTRALARYNGSVGKTWYPQRVFKSLARRWYRQ